MKKISCITLSSVLMLTSLYSHAAMTRSNFRCQIEGEASSRSLNSVIKYRDLDLSFLKDSSGATEKMNVTLRGTRTSKISVRVGGPKGNPEDGMSLMISEKDFRGDPPQQPADPAAKNKGSANTQVNLPGASVITSLPTTIALAGSIKFDPAVQPSEDKYELQTVVADSSETLTFDYLNEMVLQQYEYNETVEENALRESRNDERKAEYMEKMLQYQEELRNASLDSLNTGKPVKTVYKPYEPNLEPMLALPRGPINISYSYREFETARSQPPTTLNVTLNSSQIANLECIKTQNLVDHKTQVEQDVKGKYNGGAGAKPDPRAKALNFVVPTINRMEREPWCLKKIVKGTINLAHFDKGTFNVSCEYAGSVPSDN